MPFRRSDESLIRDFYSPVLDHEELDPPASVSHLGLIWFAAGTRAGLYFFTGSPDPTSLGHFCFDVADLDATRSRRVEAGAKPYDDTPIPNRPRFFCRDPSGNLLESTSVMGDYRG
jgi:catechol 2,3-dioxygenase-like lactoylglutathione lyase family enzyme